MSPTRVLWVDLRRARNDDTLTKAVARHVRLDQVDDAADLDRSVRDFRPQLLVFDYDWPNPGALKLLQSTKASRPGLPILMLTEAHSEALAIWALRTRVWDYLVKPVDEDVILQRVAMLSSFSGDGAEPVRRVSMPYPNKPPLIRPPRDAHKPLSTAPAVRYIRAHIDEKIGLEDMARLCKLSPYQFSRAFRREHGISFREYLLQHRIGRALKLLVDSELPVTEISMAAGFNNLSHFTRTFQQYIGLSPSRYRQQQTPD